MYIMTPILRLLALLCTFLLPTSAATISKDRSFGIDPPTSASLIHLNSTLRGQPTCNLPYLPPFQPVSLKLCEPAFTMLLNSQGSNLPQQYQKMYRNPIEITKYKGCYVRLDTPRLWVELNISLKRIVDNAREVLRMCERYGQGGWMRIDVSRSWVISVNGFGEGGGNGGRSFRKAEKLGVSSGDEES